MAVSGSINLVATGTDIITEALEQLGVLPEGVAPSTAQTTSSLRTLNYMVKAWQSEQTNLFVVQRTYLFVQKDVNEYALDSTASGAHWTTSFINTTLAVAAVALDSTVEVQDATGISSGDNIGIALDAGGIFWTTVNGAPAGNVITLTTAISGAAAIGKVVYAYTTRAERPRKIVKALYSDIDNIDTPLFVTPLDIYADLPLKTSDGHINTLYYDPQITSGKLYVWPEGDRSDAYLTLWVQRTIYDIDVGADDLDYPQEWYLALALNLAILLAPKYGTPRVIRDEIRMNAAVYKELAESDDTEQVIYFEPANESNRTLV